MKECFEGGMGYIRRFEWLRQVECAYLGSGRICSASVEYAGCHFSHSWIGRGDDKRDGARIEFTDGWQHHLWVGQVDFFYGDISKLWST